MNNNHLEIQREAIVEIVGTQYDGRAEHHQGLMFRQKLLMQHQCDNPHDANAILILTEDGKPLGFMPKGYASLYAPAIDSGRYSFTVEVLNAAYDPERPILIVKITAELPVRSEQEIERICLQSVQEIVDCCAQSRSDYLKFISAAAVDAEALVHTLNRARLYHKLCAASENVIAARDIRPSDSPLPAAEREALCSKIDDVSADLSDILKKIQKAYNETLEIEDEEEYHRVQKEMREKRNRFRALQELFA